MTWTVFQHQAGHNETSEMAPGRGGYKYVMVPTDMESAINWWETTFDGHPATERPVDQYEPGYSSWDNGWSGETFDSEREARLVAGQKMLEQGGIGSPMKEAYTWPELYGRLDVWVVTADEVNDAL